MAEPVEMLAVIKIRYKADPDNYDGSTPVEMAGIDMDNIEGDPNIIMDLFENAEDTDIYVSVFMHKENCAEDDNCICMF